MDAGILEIYRYVPAALLKKPVEDMDMEEFLGYLAKARYLEEVECNIFTQALAKLFED